MTSAAAILINLIVSLGPVQTRTATPTKAAVPSTPHTSSTPPTWARDARWYYVVVSRFDNGDPSNDPPGTLPWTGDWPADPNPVGGDPAKLDARRYGGDLQGLRRRLNYLKDLKINLLYLSNLFHPMDSGVLEATDLRHIADSLAAKGSLSRIQGETSDSKSWTFSRSDRIFLDVLKEAHRQGFRIVLDIDFANTGKAVATAGRREQYLFDVTRRWMDPDGNGDPSDGVNGWVQSSPRKTPHAFWKRWRSYVKKINPQALLVADLQGDPDPWLHGEFDVAFCYRAAKAITRFFADYPPPLSPKAFLAELAASRRHRRLDTLLASPVPLSGPRTGRLLSTLSAADAAEKDPAPASSRKTFEKARNRWRLAVLFQHFYLGSPMTYYGDEVGLYGTQGPLSRAPMRWKDPSGTTPVSYRDDFASLIQWLHMRRDLDEPIRHGSFHTVLLDDKHSILAIARTLPGNEAVLVMNYGNTKRMVMLPVGKPGQLVSLLSPYLGLNPHGSRARRGHQSQPPGIPPLPMGATRQFVNPQGLLRVWVNPHSVRLLLLRST